MTEQTTITTPFDARVEFGTAADVERRAVLRVTTAITFLARDVRRDGRDLPPRIVYTGRDPWPWTALVTVRDRQVERRDDGVSTRRSLGATGRTPHHALACLLDAVRLEHQRVQLRDTGHVYTSEVPV